MLPGYKQKTLRVPLQLRAASLCDCVPQCSLIQSRYSATSCVTRIIRPRILRKKTIEVSVNESFTLCSHLALGLCSTDKVRKCVCVCVYTPFRFVVRVVLGDGGDGVAQDHVRVIERLLHLHGPIGAPSDIMT